MLFRSDRRYDLEIDFLDAARGSVMSIPTLNGNKDIIIPAGTQPGEVLSLKGEGLPHLKGFGKGDLRVEVKVVVPRHLSDRQKNLLEQLAAAEDPGRKYQKPPPAKGWLDKVWDFIGSFTGKG